MTLESTQAHSAAETSIGSMPPSMAAPVASSYEDGEMQYIPLSSIGIAPDFNPRTYFDSVAMESLIDSIRVKGLIQPIVVRPAPEEGRFYLVAGERRFRACQSAALEEIPVVIRLFDEGEAFEVATIENCEREDMSVAEEAKAARRVLSNRGGDREEAAKYLGWTIDKLNSRLALLHAIEPVLIALTERRIRIGHAELLATLDENMQEGTLKAVLQNNFTVNELREKLGSFAQELSKAVFDTAGCAGCQYNSTAQASLFDEHIATGRCTNRACWADKEFSFASAKRDELAGTYSVIKLDTESDPDTRTVLMLDDVGRDQFLSCKGCANFGCVMSTRPGSVGSLTEEICFDLSCHGKMKKSRADAIKSAAASQSVTPPAKPAAAGKSDALVKPASKPATERASVPKKVLDKVVEVQTNAAHAAVLNDKTMLMVVAAAELVMTALKSAAKPYLETLEKVLKEHGIKVSVSTQRDEMLRVFGKMANEGRATEIVTIYSHAVAVLACRTDAAFEAEPKKRIKSVQVVLDVAKVDLQAHFRMDKDFLGSHTKSGIESLMAEAGFIAWYDIKNGEGSFKKLMSKKNDELVDAILAAGFDFSAFLPQAVKVAA
jgi:PRTRC genetic system ParB family protein